MLFPFHSRIDCCVIALSNTRNYCSRKNWRKALLKLPLKQLGQLVPRHVHNLFLIRSPGEPVIKLASSLRKEWTLPSSSICGDSSWNFSKSDDHHQLMCAAGPNAFHQSKNTWMYHVRAVCANQGFIFMFWHVKVFPFALSRPPCWVLTNH